ncbi:MAG: prepilin-type N-terminal cleavage/methylation domain-containing protein [Mariprofundus sp.]|nr:prepilin-type N-terminal cleavage/methylation domain-containing protein [Mariprofundus sp.]
MSGFTLIEILVALVIISVAVLSIGSFTISIVSSDQVSRERATAVSLAEQILEYWQHDTNDYAPLIATADCGLTTSTTAPAYPVSVTCTPTSGMGIPYTIITNQQQATGPLPANLSSFKKFTKQGYTITPKTKVATVSWTNQGKMHTVYLTNLSKVQ